MLSDATSLFVGLEAREFAGNREELGGYFPLLPISTHVGVRHKSSMQ